MSMQRATPAASSARSLRSVIAAYQRPQTWPSVWQIANSFVPYLVIWYLMYLSLSISYALTLLLAVLAGGFLVRIFIILHDCGHGSFFRSQRANDIVGTICGIFTFTPYFLWRHDHAVHHATVGDLDRRGVGDVHTLTVREYLALSRWERFKYRIFRHPFVMLTAGPIWAFLINQRIPPADARPRERFSVHLTNVALALVIIGMSLLIGLEAYLLIQLPVALFAATAAIWLFYCQHQFEGTYWARHDEWDFEIAALKGSSYFKLPRVLQWFTGNIGFHHVHHYSPRIPNYNLEACHNADPRFQDVATITVRSSFSYFSLKLWDEDRQDLVSLKEIEQAEARQAAVGASPKPSVPPRSEQ